MIVNYIIPISPRQEKMPEGPIFHEISLKRLCKNCAKIKKLLQIIQGCGIILLYIGHE